MFTDISKEEQEINLKNKFEKMLNIPMIVRLRILDPRVQHFSCYGNINKSHVNEIKKEYPDIKVKYGLFGIKEIENNKLNQTSFTIYSVKSESQRDRLIEKHEAEYQKQKEEDIKNGVKY